MNKETKANNPFICKNEIKLETINGLIADIEQNINNNSGNFRFHTREDKNDYAEWIKYEFGLDNLSEEIRKTKSPQETVILIKKYFEEKNENKVKEETREEEKPLKEETEKKEQTLKNIINQEENKTEPIEDKKIIDMKNFVESFSQSSENQLNKVKEMKNKIHKHSNDLLKELELVNEGYLEVYNKISEARKEGKDMFIPQLKLKNIKSKINFFEASKNIYDYEKIILLLKDIKQEIYDELNYNSPDIRKEILESIGIKEAINVTTNN